MGQQLSGESYCLETVQKLISELNTTDNQVSESHVTCDAADCANAFPAVENGSGGCCRIAFPWREWARVSKFLERVLPNSEQKRLLSYVLLDQTGLRNYSLCDATDATVDSEGDSIGGSGFGSSSGNCGPQPTAASLWSVHLNYGDESDKNAVLYRDFVKVHFQLDNLSHPQSAAASNFATDPIFNFSGSHDSGISSLSAASALGTELTDRLTDLLKQQCSKISVGLVVTRSAYHSRDNCVVISCTVDIRSILRNTGCLELCSRINYNVEDADIGDQVQRSLSGLRDKLASQQGIQHPSTTQQQTHGQQQQSAYFPMLLYLCDTSNRVILIYGRQLRMPADQGTGT